MKIKELKEQIKLFKSRKQRQLVLVNGKLPVSLYVLQRLCSMLHKDTELELVLQEDSIVLQYTYSGVSFKTKLTNPLDSDSATYMLEKPIPYSKRFEYKDKTKYHYPYGPIKNGKTPCEGPYIVNV